MSCLVTKFHPLPFRRGLESLNICGEIASALNFSPQGGLHFTYPAHTPWIRYLCVNFTPLLALLEECFGDIACGYMSVFYSSNSCARLDLRAGLSLVSCGIYYQEPSHVYVALTPDWMCLYQYYCPFADVSFIRYHFGFVSRFLE